MLREPNLTGKIVHMSYQLRVQDSLKRKLTNGNPHHSKQLSLMDRDQKTETYQFNVLIRPELSYSVGVD